MAFNSALVACVLAASAACIAAFGGHHMPSAGMAKPADYVYKTYPIVPELKSVDGVLECDLNVTMKYLDVDGFKFWTRVYNGIFPGPTLVANPGDTMKVHFKNMLGPNDYDPERGILKIYQDINTTNLHVHGLHVSPLEPQDMILLVIEPGMTYDYEYELPIDHAPGTHWYHPHNHGTTALQVAGGMSGAIIIEDHAEAVNEEFMTLPTDLLYLQHFILSGFNNIFELIDATGEAGASDEYKEAVDSLYDPIRAEAGEELSYYMVNGVYKPTMALQPGQAKRIRLVNASHRDNLQLELVGCEMALYARDGVQLAVPEPMPYIWLVPGSRRDFIVICEEPGFYGLKGVAQDTTGEVDLGLSSTADTFGADSNWYSDFILFIEVEGEQMDDSRFMTMPNKVIEEWSSYLETDIRQDYPEEMMEKRIVTYMDNSIYDDAGNWVGTIDNAPWRLMIDGVTLGGDAHGTRPGMCIKWNKIIEWQINNPTSMSHPVHIHINPFSVIALNGISTLDESSPDTYMGHNWLDVTPLPQFGSALIRFRTADFWGVYVHHCHILWHEDEGMMQIIEVYREDHIEGTCADPTMVYAGEPGYEGPHGGGGHH